MGRIAMTRLEAADGHTFPCYRADPVDAPIGAVVVVHEMFGITPHIRKIADDFAALGYVAVAPALFDRIRPDVELGYDDAGLAEGTGLVQQADVGACLADLQATVAALKDTGKVGIVGYAWGGFLAYLAANAVPGLACAVGYYGGGIVDGPVAKRRVPTLLHFAESDPAIPVEEVEQFRARRPDVSAFTYTAGAGFTSEASGAFDQPATEAADARTSFWLSQYLVGQPPILLKNSGAYAAQKVDKKKSKKPAGDDIGPPLD
jgi:carboxymethylenebutenolidase